MSGEGCQGPRRHAESVARAGLRRAMAAWLRTVESTSYTMELSEVAETGRTSNQSPAATWHSVPPSTSTGAKRRIRFKGNAKGDRTPGTLG